jgi:hypothetical protein
MALRAFCINCQNGLLVSAAECILRPFEAVKVISTPARPGEAGKIKTRANSP